jgi:hypothetical protein
MSRENVELIRRTYEEFNRTLRGSTGERQRAVLFAADPEVEWHTSFTRVGGSVVLVSSFTL